MLEFISSVVIILAVIFLRIGRSEISLRHWHRPYFFHVLGISIPLAILSGWLLSIEEAQDEVFYNAILICLQLIAVPAYFMTAWLSLIFVGALTLQTFTSKQI